MTGYFSQPLYNHVATWTSIASVQIHLAMNDSSIVEILDL
jgi:hypothetical protein